MIENLQSLKVTKVRMWDEDEEEFYEMVFDVIFSDTKISLSIPSQNFNTNIDLPEYKILPINIQKQNGIEIEELTTIVTIANVVFAMSYSNALRVEEFYIRVNKNTEEKIEMVNQNVDLLCDTIDSNVLEMARNVLKLTDDKILLNHDAVILLQRINNLNKVENIEFYDENLSDNAKFTEFVNPLYEAINNFADLLEEEYCIDSDMSKSVSWELVKRVSINYYSNQWENIYAKYLGTPLKKNENPESEPDGTTDRYIEMIISCNEINHKSDEVLALFTYHMMEKGYTIGMQYFPAYFDICKQAFEVIEENLRKNSFKNKLKGNVEIKESHYSIDDIDIMNGSEFENFIGSMFSKMGYSAEVTKHSGDQGIDVIAERNGKKIGIQAKCYSNSVGNSAIQEAVAGKNYYKCDRVIVVTNNTFTNSAIELAQVNDVILWDRNILKEKISELY